MECAQIREALSARLDGEAADLPDPVVDDHLGGCRACAAWSEEVATLHRMVRVREAERVPDLSVAIVEAFVPEGRRAKAGPARGVLLGEHISGARWALFVVALTQLVLAGPALLLGEDTGATIHVAREVGSFGVALAVGLLVAAWQPARAWGLLPLATSSTVEPRPSARRTTCSRWRGWPSSGSSPATRGRPPTAEPASRPSRPHRPHPVRGALPRSRRPSGRRRPTRPLVGLAVVLLALVATPALAGAHASLIAADPPDGARLDQSPKQIQLTFSEHVSASLGGVRVVDT
jgi:hypothetical protein